MSKLKIFRTVSTNISAGTSPFAVSDALGSKKSFNVPTDGIVRGITLVDPDDQTFTAQVWFYRQEPTGLATNSAMGMTDADAQLVTAVQLLPASFDSLNNQVRWTECAIPYHAPDSKLWVQCQVVTGTPTFPSNALNLTLHIENE